MKYVNNLIECDPSEIIKGSCFTDLQRFRPPILLRSECSALIQLLVLIQRSWHPQY
jgi:hypothetical protein